MSCIDAELQKTKDDFFAIDLRDLAPLVARSPNGNGLTTRVA
jgi:hypothetical protein